MKLDVTREVARMQAEHRKKNRRRRVLSTMAAVVVFCTTYALILPAITMSTECGLEEHVHTAACYTPFVEESRLQLTECSLTGHSHTEACAADETCGLIGDVDVIVHVHEDHCFAWDGTLICPLEEVELHQHSAECYEVHEESAEEEPELLCGRAELVLHTHTEECLGETGEQICTQLQVITHQHGEGCLRVVRSSPDKTEFTCRERESREEEGHIHDENCYTHLTLRCELPEHTHTGACGITYKHTAVFEDDSVILTLELVSVTPIPEDLTFALREIGRLDADYAPYADYAVQSVPGQLRTLSAYEIVFFSGGEEIPLADAEITARLQVKELDIPAEEDVVPLSTFSLRDPILPMEGGDAAAEAETEETEAVTDGEEDTTAYQLHLTALKAGDSGVFGADSTVVHREDEAAEVMTIRLGSARTFALARSVEPLPTFEIHYLCNMLRYYTPSDTSMYLEVINTASTEASVPVPGPARGGLLPENGKGTSASPNANSIDKLYLEPSSVSGKYRVAMDYELIEVYEPQLNVIYSNSMTSTQMDVLRENDHYGVTHIQTRAAGSTDWVDHEVNDQTRINDVTYVWHEVDDLFYFTNNPSATTDSAGREPIVITDGMAIRYVYYPTSSELAANAYFYDYDISDGTHTVSGGVTTMDTGRQGINKTSNYINGSGAAHLAFGNSNTGSGWQNDTIGGYTINQYNRSSYRGLTFGMVTGYDVNNGHLIYNTDIIAPYLFSYNPTSAAVAGKTTYSNTKMNFRRDGDTYTFTSVSGSDSISDSQLELFEITYNVGTTRLLSNSFWPFDNINDGTGGHDIHFGSAAAHTNSTENFSGLQGDGITAATGRLPKGDEGAEHNSYFGLEYDIEFHLDGSYTGPLEYLFYGDDDMWVFLTDRTDPNNVTTQLIADIGGVHSSVGSYTDLWDWVPNTPERPNGKGDYSLHFFYTERGASGSSCYMQFTIPDAHSDPLESPETGTVEVKKELAGGMTTDDNFLFNYEIVYPTGLPEAERDRILPYVIYDAAGNEVTAGGLFRAGQFTLQGGQKIVIGNIPKGSDFVVSEENAGSNFDTVWTTVPTNVTVDGGVVTGTITQNGEHLAFVCTNTYDSLTLTKQVSVEAGIPVPEDFTFQITLKDSGGAPLTGTVNTVIREADGDYAAPVTTTLTEGTFTVKLKMGESVSVYPLPEGATYTITETDGGGLLPTWPDGTGNDIYSDTVSGTIASGNTAVTCINRAYYRLPSTGGPGTVLYTMGGLLMMFAAAGLLGYKIWRKKEEAFF